MAAGRFSSPPSTQYRKHGGRQAGLCQTCTKFLLKHLGIRISAFDLVYWLLEVVSLLSGDELPSSSRSLHGIQKSPGPRTGLFTIRAPKLAANCSRPPPTCRLAPKFIGLAGAAQHHAPTVPAALDRSANPRRLCRQRRHWPGARLRLCAGGPQNRRHGQGAHDGRVRRIAAHIAKLPELLER